MTLNLLLNFLKIHKKTMYFYANKIDFPEHLHPCKSGALPSICGKIKASVNHIISLRFKSISLLITRLGYVQIWRLSLSLQHAAVLVNHQPSFLVSLLQPNLSMQGSTRAEGPRKAVEREYREEKNSWLRDVCCCSSLTALPGPVWDLLNYDLLPLFLSFAQR